MAKRKIGPVLAEIIEAIDGIQNATAGKSLADFEKNWLLRHGVQRGIEIISEACRHIPDSLLETRPEVPWKQVRGIGNLLRHEYHRIADDLIWAVVTNNLSPLREAIEALQRDLAE